MREFAAKPVTFDNLAEFIKRVQSVGTSYLNPVGDYLIIKSMSKKNRQMTERLREKNYRSMGEFQYTLVCRIQHEKKCSREQAFALLKSQADSALKELRDGFSRIYNISNELENLQQRPEETRDVRHGFGNANITIELLLGRLGDESVFQNFLSEFAEKYRGAYI